MSKNPHAVELGRKGAKAPHQTRGLQAASMLTRKRVARAGVAARKANPGSGGVRKVKKTKDK
jgi:hypothetical protein